MPWLFSVAVIKYPEPKQCAGIKVNFSLQFREVESALRGSTAAGAGSREITCHLHKERKNAQGGKCKDRKRSREVL